MSGLAVTQIEKQFGPPSEPVSIAEFIGDAKQILEDRPSPTPTAREIVQGLDTSQRLSVEADCDVRNIQSLLHQCWNSPRVSAYLTKLHDPSPNVLNLSDKAPPKNKFQTRIYVNEDSPEVVALKKSLASIKLSSWSTPPEASLFMRTPTHTDTNTLRQPKPTPSGASVSDPKSTAILVISTYAKSHLGLVTKHCQHAFLSSQSLGDVFEGLPCPFNGMPSEIRDARDRVVAYEESSEPENTGYVMCIDGLAYGDGQSENDYADKLIEHLKKFPSKRIQNLKKADTCMHDTRLDSLTLQLGKPYWLLHRGNCEHFLVVDEIRMLSSHDPQSDYPFTLHLTPISLDHCRACTKLPAVYSIVGDVRLKKSPCMLCKRCWERMGDSKEDGVVVVPLPRYELGW